MDNDKLFTAYATFLVAGTATVITWAILGQGGEFPPMAFVIEHISLSLLFRSAYKSFDGSNWVRDALEFADMVGREAREAASSAAPTADATS